jgi:hypothetical protein
LGAMEAAGSDDERKAAPGQGHRWTGHPGVRSGDELMAGERAVDRLRNGMGSWTFVLASQLLDLLDRPEGGRAAHSASHGRHPRDDRRDDRRSTP